MISTPHVFLAADCSSLAEVRRLGLPEEDQLLFDPGLHVLEALCQVVSGRPPGPEGHSASSDDLQYLDGPPHPVSDEGFQLFRVSAPLVRRFAALSAGRIDELVSSFLQQIGRRGEPAALAAALTRLAELARRAEKSGQALLVKVLYT